MNALESIRKHHNAQKLHIIIIDEEEKLSEPQGQLQFCSSAVRSVRVEQEMHKPPGINTWFRREQYRTYIDVRGADGPMLIQVRSADHKDESLAEAKLLAERWQVSAFLVDHEGMLWTQRRETRL